MQNHNMNINNEWLTKPTGDPFADVGGLVIQFLTEQEQYANLTILELIEEVAKIYVNKWGGKLHSFFHGSKITNPSIKETNRKISGTVELFKDIINHKERFEKGFCRITGRNTELFTAGANLYILVGSGGFINYHHGFQEGILVSKEVLVRLFFVPFGVEYLGDKIALLLSNSIKVNQYLIKQKLIGVNGHIKTIASGMSEGVAKSDFYNPINALFNYADKCIKDLDVATFDEELEKSVTEGITLNLYHFTGFITSPDVQIYVFPAILFKFYAYCLKNYRKEWTNFINYHYKNSKFKEAVFNEANETWENSKEQVNYEEYKVWRNPIYENLLNDKSLLNIILKWSRTRKLSFKIVEIYQINIKNMEQKTLHKIKELADFIVRNPDADTIKKSISRLNGIKSSAEIRHYLLKLIAENYNAGNQKPLITIEEFVEYLFPDGAGWREIRDLLLIAIYQKLHEIPDIKIELLEIEDENEFETQND